MKPIKFPEHNVVYAENQEEYIPLPAFKADTPEGEVVSCWKLSFRERLRILFTGKLWVMIMTFNNPLTPSLFTTKKGEVLVVDQGKPFYIGYGSKWLQFKMWALNSKALKWFPRDKWNKYDTIIFVAILAGCLTAIVLHA